jgi:hypothetical protein
MSRFSHLDQPKTAVMGNLISASALGGRLI